MEMHNFIEIMIDEFGCDKKEAEKALNYANEKMKEVSPDLSIPEQIDEYLGKFDEYEQEQKDFLKERILSVIGTNPESAEEAFREGIRISKELSTKMLRLRLRSLAATALLDTLRATAARQSA